MNYLCMDPTHTYKFFDRNMVNIDTSNKCTIECPKCTRQHWKGKYNQLPGGWMTDHEWSLYLERFDRFIFSGQISDPILHPKMDKILADTYREKKEYVAMHVAASHKKPEWFEKCFKANPNATWYFGIDGLPKDSHKYRVNQDGEKLFQMMLLSKIHVKRTVWQYIIFNYNEDDLDEAKEMADKVNIEFLPLMSSRYTDDDPLKPSSKFAVKRNDWGRITSWQKSGNQNA